MEKIQFITHCNGHISHVESARLALEGGCRWIQLRMKGASWEDIIRTGEMVKSLCQRYNATFIINDSADLCRILKADGVHLGKNDMPVADARKILGSNYIIGSTANTFDDIQHAVRSGADYIGCGPLRFTTTKDKLSPTLGLSGYAEIINEVQKQKLTVPIYAIGGVTADDISSLLNIGLHGIALSGYVLNAPNPTTKMNEILEITNKYIQQCRI